jgi:hypothetical protein
MRKDAFSLPVGNELWCGARPDQARSARGDFELQRHFVKIARRESAGVNSGTAAFEFATAPHARSRHAEEQRLRVSKDDTSDHRLDRWVVGQVSPPICVARGEREPRIQTTGRQ